MRFDQYLDRIQSIHVRDYQRDLNRYEQYLGPTKNGQIQNHQDIVTRLDSFLDRIQSRQILLQQWRSYLLSAFHLLQVAVDSIIAKFVQRDDEKQLRTIQSRNSAAIDYPHDSAASMNFSVGREHAYQRIENREPQRASEYVCRCARIRLELHVTVACLLGQALSAFSAWLGPNFLYTYPGSFAGRIYSFYTPPL
jgi:hypothetical protein